MWTNLECHPPRMGKVAHSSDTPAGVWSTPKWPHWTTAAPPLGSESTPQCLWRASCESKNKPEFVSMFSELHVCVKFLSSLVVVGTMEPSAEQMQSLCSGCAKRPVTWWGIVRPARMTTPSPSSKDSTTIHTAQKHTRVCSNVYTQSTHLYYYFTAPLVCWLCVFCMVATCRPPHLLGIPPLTAAAPRFPDLPITHLIAAFHWRPLLRPAEGSAALIGLVYMLTSGWGFLCAEASGAVTSHSFDKNGQLWWWRGGCDFSPLCVRTTNHCSAVRNLKRI